MSELQDAERIELGDLNYQEVLREQTRASGGEIREDEDLLLMAGPGAHPMYNFAVRLRADADADRCVVRARTFFADRGAGFSLILMNAFDEGEMRRRAEASGMVSLIAPPAMFCDEPLADVALAESVELRVVERESGLVDFRTVSARAWQTYSIPPAVPQRIFRSMRMVRTGYVTSVVAYAGGRPGSCALVALSHGMGGVYWVGTDPDFRGRGLAEACTRFVTNAAFSAGARFVCLQASPMGEPIYRRMGYRSLGEYGLLVAPPP